MTIKDILDNFINENNNKSIEELTEEQRFEKIYSKNVGGEIFESLKSRFDNLKIEIIGKYEGNLIDLMKRGLLEGWCWQTTETAILFMDDDTYIERGDLKFHKYKTYYHSWLVFSYNNEEYVFDPCFEILCKKKYYDKIFEVELKGKVTGKQVKEYFINYINNPPKRELYSEEVENFMKKFFSRESLDRKNGEIVVHDEENPNAPMYRNNVGYKATIEDGKIKKLVAHYYLNA